MFLLFLSTTMISSQVTLVPSYLIIRNLNWVDHYEALIVPFLANAFGVFMIRQSFRTIPKEMEEAAKLDGCGRLRFFGANHVAFVQTNIGFTSPFCLHG